MGFLSEISSFVSGVCSAVSSVCSTIGGAVMGGVSKFVSGLPPLFPELGILRIVIGVIAAVAELICGKPEEETPEEIGVKAEICKEEENKGPEDFESTQAYIEHLRKDIEIPPERSIEKLSEEEKMKYAAIGTGLYVQDMGERYQMTLEPEFWRSVCAAGIRTEQLPSLLDTMKEHGIEHGRDVDLFFSGSLEPGSEQKRDVSEMLRDHLNKSGDSRTVADLQDAYDLGVKNAE